MTDLERARGHLQYEQVELAAARKWLAMGARPSDLRHAEEAVLAALTWVWEEQQIYRAACDEWWGNRSEYA